ncbi:alpha/beta fold hydrolase [Aquifex aeolicus]|uniref:AB hydrolase-1 domain-containing protein n=1 Tax=Aquifex aeolicus (strain VF5) TaxID=224324 RepID=O67895_AQUAE|nr:alpha/beta hydrolase [Aquifex aeolicus]AAC07858.1 putative protein [Aquifex aeolicus VF5]
MLKNPLFIHGWAFSSKVFNDFHGIKYDLPGHGKNKNPYESIEKVVEEIGKIATSKHDVVGWSLGGSLALLFAYRYPEKVNRLILIGTTPHFKGAWSEKNIRAMKLLIKKKGIKAFRELAYGKFEDFFDEEQGMRFLEDYVNLNLYTVLPYIKKEVYLIHGVSDRIVPYSEAYKLHRALKCSKLILLGGGHFPVRNEEHLRKAILKGY